MFDKQILNSFTLFSYPLSPAPDCVWRTWIHPDVPGSKVWPQPNRHSHSALPRWFRPVLRGWNPFFVVPPFCSKLCAKHFHSMQSRNATRWKVHRVLITRIAWQAIYQRTNITECTWFAGSWLEIHPAWSEDGVNKSTKSWASALTRQQKLRCW